MTTASVIVLSSSLLLVLKDISLSFTAASSNLVSEILGLSPALRNFVRSSFIFFC